MPHSPHRELPAFYADLASRPGLSARALQLIILTAARSGEVRGMTAGEVDLDTAVWTVPAVRMKAKREHRVPLTPAAVDLLRSLNFDLREPADLVFPGPSGKTLSDMVFKALLGRMGHDGITTHGFRSTFRDWAADETNHPREVIEASLAHLVGDATERAYRRGDALDKRRQLLTDWARFVTPRAA